MKSYYKFVSCNKCITLVIDIDSRGGYGHVEEGIHGKSCPQLCWICNIALNIKSFKKWAYYDLYPRLHVLFFFGIPLIILASKQWGYGSTYFYFLNYHIQLMNTECRFCLVIYFNSIFSPFLMSILSTNIYSLAM